MVPDATDRRNGDEKRPRAQPWGRRPSFTELGGEERGRGLDGMDSAERGKRGTRHRSRQSLEKTGMWETTSSGLEGVLGSRESACWSVSWVLAGIIPLIDLMYI